MSLQYSLFSRLIMYELSRSLIESELWYQERAALKKVGTFMARIPLRVIFTFYHVCHTKNDYWHQILVILLNLVPGLFSSIPPF